MSPHPADRPAVAPSPGLIRAEVPANVRADVRADLAAAVLLMLGSLAMVLVAGALARTLGAHYAAEQVLFLRFVVSLAVVGPAAVALAGRPASIRRALTIRRPLPHAVRAVTGVAAALIFYKATQHLPFADLVALSTSAPIFVALLSRLLTGERVSAPSAACIVAGLAGVFLVAPPTQLAAWSLAAVAMAALNAVCILATRKAARSDGPAATGLVFVLAGTLLTLPAALADFRTPALEDLTVFLMLGLAAGAAIVLNVKAFRLAPAALLAPIDYLGIAASVVVGYVWWGEIPTLAAAAGGALITVAGIANVLLAGRLQNPAPDQAAPNQADLGGSTSRPSTR